MGNWGEITLLLGVITPFITVWGTLSMFWIMFFGPESNPRMLISQLMLDLKYLRILSIIIIYTKSWRGEGVGFGQLGCG